MRFETGDVGLHDHAHAQEGAEDVGVVVQQLLLHLDGDLRTLGRIEGGAQLDGKFLELVAVVAAGVLDRFVQTVGVEEVLGIAQAGVDVGADPDVPCRGILADAVVILGAVDLYVNADVLERGLRGFGQQGQLLTGRVGQPADRELDAVLFADAVAVGVDPAGGLQLGPGLIGIKGHGLNALTEREAVGEGAVAV